LRILAIFPVLERPKEDTGALLEGKGTLATVPRRCGTVRRGREMVMASALTATITPDTVISFEINPGTLLELLDARAEGGPRLKCFEGSVTLVSPGRSHEWMATRLDYLILAICLELGIKFTPLESTTWTLPFGLGDTGYEADKAYYIQSYGTTRKHHPPDLAVEVVVSHSEKKALRAGAFLKIPEMWVLNVARDRLSFYHLVARGKQKGNYRVEPRSRAFPALTSAEVLDRLNDPETDAAAFHENCRAWARDVLAPRRVARNGGN
jgi:Uma2 family endonuclease